LTLDFHNPFDFILKISEILIQMDNTRQPGENAFFNFSSQIGQSPLFTHLMSLLCTILLWWHPDDSDLRSHV